MSSGNNTNSSNNSNVASVWWFVLGIHLGSPHNGANKVDWQHVATPDLVEHVDDLLEVQIAKFDEQSRRRRNKLMKRAAEKEAQKKAEEERKKAKEEAKRAAEEEVRRLAKEDAQKRAEFQARWKADSERKAREKAEAKAAAEVMRAQIAQKAGQGEKPKPKPKQHWAASQHAPNEEVQGWYPLCDRCRKSGDSKGCVLPNNTRTPTCQRCQKMKVKCHFEVSTAMMTRSASGEKCKESETLATVVATLLTEEIEEALGGFSVAGPSMQPDPVTQVLDWRLGEVIAAIDCNTRELARLGGKMDGFMWEMKRMADHSDRKGKGRAQTEETEDEEEKSDDGEDKEEVDNVSDADAEGEDVDE
ncbi:hypothetical protein SCLCIDRAFT_22274 [Scleroderma citrinum Foug A]|uniref:Uncharacterized protein n=1 Tax=Scleroderma citrinum Foug A TaxID=1036808 RepID=A0A0C3AM70_9AGAM|nr:hypothetical protein SCLCIDRAFT_22274 [Scleroderma citrinum Foug A]